MTWERFLAEEQRRVRGGAPLTRTRLDRAVALGLAPGPTNDALDAALRRSGPDGRGAALLRAVAVAAEIEDRALSNAAAALVLCAEGRTDVVRLLPFVTVQESDRARALVEWSAGEPAPWQSLALDAVATASRARRVSVESLLREAPEREADALERMGRAAITARRALRFLSDALVATISALADALEVSIPAASDAVLRLTEAGLVTELTGRRRGRVFAYMAALAVADETPR